MGLSLREKAERRLSKVENPLMTVEQMMEWLKLESRVAYRGLTPREWRLVAEYRTLGLKQEGKNPEEYDVSHPGCRKKDYTPYGWG